MTYKDMTFCRASECQQFPKCFRALTPKVEEAAKQIGLPISQFSDPQQLDCYLPPTMPSNPHNGK
jgi:hypothetical protein